MPGRTRHFRLLSLAAVLTLLAAGLSPAAEKEKARVGEGAKAPAYQPTGVRMETPALTAFIDKTIDARLRAETVDASPSSDDAEFLRRAYLDLAGHIPPADKAAAFLDSKEPDKRARLIDELLAGPDFGKHQADIWQALLLPRTSDNRRFDTAPFTKWLEERFNSDAAWDKTVTEMLTTTGEVEKNPAGDFFVVNTTVDKMTDTTARAFLGLQLQCAQCHNHPFTDWKQTDYWGMAAFYMRVQATDPRVAMRGGTLEVTETPFPRRGRNQLPESAKMLPPKFLAGTAAKVGAREPLRPVLAAWLTGPDNPYFARAMVNRAWSQLFGRGIVMPVDDMHEGNAPSHPELLGELAWQFGHNGYDIKALYRAICNSKAYQRTSKPAGNNGEASPALFARMSIKVLTGEQLFDSLTDVLGQPRFAGPGRARPGAGGPGFAGNPRAAFVAFFQTDDGADPTEYQVGIPQALRLMNAPALNSTARLGEIMKSHKTPEGVIEQLFLMTLSRRPTEKETARYVAYVAARKDPRDGYGDLLWALLNSSAFTLNH